MYLKIEILLNHDKNDIKVRLIDEQGHVINKGRATKSDRDLSSKCRVISIVNKVVEF